MLNAIAVRIHSLTEYEWVYTLTSEPYHFTLIDQQRSQPGLRLLPADALQSGAVADSENAVRSPSNLDESKPKKAPARSKGASKDVGMLTPLERGKDLEQKVIKLKGECGNLQCQMQTLEFGAGLAKELGKLEKEFECCPQQRSCMQSC